MCPMKRVSRNKQFDFSPCIQLIARLKNLNAAQLSEDTLIQTVLNKIKLKANSPLSSEQVICILNELLSLKHEYRVGSVIQALKLHDPETTFILADAIWPLIEQEQEFKPGCEFRAGLRKCINDFTLREGSEKDFYQQIKSLTSTHLSCIDIDYVMQAADSALRSKQTLNTNAILVVGISGVGKSLVINYVCAEHIFKRGFFGTGRLKINPQPPFIKHIKIGESSVSETSKMGVVEAAASESAWMREYDEEKYVLCDTPGARDNRKRKLPELILVNTLESINPLFQADSVRFLVLISSKATSARGEEFISSIKYFASMFTDPKALRKAANAIEFAISGEETKVNLEEFYNKLIDFEKNKCSHDLQDNDLAVIEILKRRFELKRVAIICPGKDYSIKPKDLMAKLHKCTPVDPDVLTPFAEEGIENLLQREQILITQSIDRILASLESDHAHESMTQQIERLAIKLTKLSFICTYYNKNHSAITAYFKKLGELIVRLREFSLDTLCPLKGEIDSEKIHKAIGNLTCLRGMDHLLAELMEVLLANDSREQLLSLIKTFDTITAPVNYKTMPDAQWSQWVMQNRPAAIATAVEASIDKYQLRLNKRLKGLMQTQANQIHVQQVDRLAQLTKDQPSPVPYAKLRSLDRNNADYIAYLESNLDSDTQHDELESYAETINKKLAKNLRVYARGYTKIETVIRRVISNLHVHNRHHDALFGHSVSNASASTTKTAIYSSAPALDHSESDQSMEGRTNIIEKVLKEQFKVVTSMYTENATEALTNNQFAVALKDIHALETNVHYLGFNYRDHVKECKNQFEQAFIGFVKLTCELIAKNNYGLLAEDDFHSLYLKLSIIEEATKLPYFAQYVAPGDYPSELQQELDYLGSDLSFRAVKAKTELYRVCDYEFTPLNYASLDSHLQEFWYLLSLPTSQHAQYATEYASIVDRVRAHCAMTTGIFIGELKNDRVIAPAQYEKMKDYIAQLASLKMTEVLDLAPEIQKLKEAITARVAQLIDKAGAVDLDVSHGDNLLVHAGLVQEITGLKNQFAGVLFDEVIEDTNVALNSYHRRVSATLDSMSSNLEVLPNNKIAELPLSVLSQMDHYLNQCQQRALFPNKVEALRIKLANYLQTFTTAKKVAIDEYLQQVAPFAQVDCVTPNPILSVLAQYQRLQKEMPLWYDQCRDPISLWLEQISALALTYQGALSEALQRASMGKNSAQSELLQCVQQLQPFDNCIKQCQTDDENRVDFRTLHRRFSNAFTAKHFGDLKGIMLAIYEGRFNEAQQLVTQNPDLAPGSDAEVRDVLLVQIGTYISASITTIERHVTQLNSSTTAVVNYMQDLFDSYFRIKSAQNLVDAGLLEGKLLERRNQLLTGVQTALDDWLVRVIATIDSEIDALYFESAITQYNDLCDTLAQMTLKPNNHEHLMAEAAHRIQAKSQQCYGQYQRPLIHWKTNRYTLGQVAKALNDAKERPYENATYGSYWLAISTHVYHVIDTQCLDLEDQFNKGQLSVDAALTAIEQLALVIKDMPKESTELYAKATNRYQKTLSIIQKSCLETKDEPTRHQLIAAFLNATDRCAPALGKCNIESIHAYLARKSRLYRKVIEADFAENKVPSNLLVEFSRLHSLFAQHMDFLQRDKDIYVTTLKDLQKKAIDKIKTASSNYASGVEQTKALALIGQGIARLIELQQIAINTQNQTALVDADLPQQVVGLLLQIKQLLVANHEKFKTALTARNIHDLDEALIVAKSFQELTEEIEDYVTACSFKSPIPDEFEALRKLNKDFSYVGFLNQVTLVIKTIRDELKVLNPSTFEAEGSGLREKFYCNLKSDIEFLGGMHVLNKHFTPDFLQHRAISGDFELAQCTHYLANFLETTFRLAFQQIQAVDTLNVDTNWIEFNRYYQELLIYVKNTCTVPCLSRLPLSKAMLLGESNNLDKNPVIADMITHETSAKGGLRQVIESRYLGQLINTIFSDYFYKLIINFLKEFEQNPTEEVDPKLVTFLAGLQKMAEDVAVLADPIKLHIKSLLNEIKRKRSNQYLASLAEHLRNEEKGFGARVVATQAIFAGMMTAERHKLTQAQDVDYVLKYMEVQDNSTGGIRRLNPGELEKLKVQYIQFDTLYKTLIKAHIETKTSYEACKQQLPILKQALLELIQANKPNRDPITGSIIWDEKVTALIPQIYAHLFAIWTLKESSAFFDTMNQGLDLNFLKNPHPAQMVGIFQLLNTIGANGKMLPNTIDELLTGQGKSVVLATTATTLALLGFAVDVGCYSEYLSERDESSFKWLFNFFDVSPYIQFGTFNRLIEDMLNRAGDLRDLVKNALFGTDIQIVPKEHHGRETIALVDEVDSLVTAFFGYMYQPYFLLNDPEAIALLDAVWTAQENGNMAQFKELLNLREYQECLLKYSGCEHIIRRAAEDMFADLKKYKQTQGHDFHVNSKGEIYYRHFDGSSTNKSKGYSTYWACRDKANKISKECRTAHEGIKVTCGAYSYADLMCDSANYRAMLGVTGTYRELSDAEKSVVKDVFDINCASFIPSAYGNTNKLRFNHETQVIVVEDDEYDKRLCEEISKNMIGKNGEPIRPVLVFFDTEEDLETFYKSAAFDAHRPTSIKMTSKTITKTAERDALINQATRAGMVTLAVKEHGRGSDFMLTEPRVIANGGMAVIDAFVPETEAEQRQHQGRAARQGQDGSFSMVIKTSELEEKFELSKDEINEARHAGRLYQLISETRNEKFSDAYQELIDDADELYEKIHTPSMEFLNNLSNLKNTKPLNKSAAAEAKQEIIEAHKQTTRQFRVRSEVNSKEAKVLILFDSTGSMGELITALKHTLANVVEALGDVLEDSNGKFQLQIAHYEDYDSDPSHALRVTPSWSCDKDVLKDFIQQVQATGGGNNSSECVEVGLFYANKLAASGHLDHVILIGDEPPTTKNDLPNVRRKPENYANALITGGAYSNARHYKVEANLLAQHGVKVSTFFTRTDKFNGLRKNGKYITQEKFANIADLTGGEKGELNLTDIQKGQKQLTTLFADKILGTIFADNQAAKAEHMERFEARMQQFSGMKK